MDVGLLLFAFAAGAVGFFAPCSVAMLPAYVAYAVRPGGEAPAPRVASRTAGLGRALSLLGLAPFLVGAGPLLRTGLAAFVPALAAEEPFLPLEVALGLLVLGAAVVAAGLALAGRGRVALRGAAFGMLASAGFLVVFLVLGLPVALLARGLAPWLNWLAVVVGAALVGLGVAALAGRSFSVPVPGLRGDVSSPRGFFLFGAGYGVASLSCTFPVFLSVVAAGLVSGGFASALAAFAAYAAGKGAVLTGVTVLTVAGGEGAGARVRRAVPYVVRASGVVLVAAGLYVAWYFGRFAPGVGG